MHEDAADSVQSLSARFVLVATTDLVGQADSLGIISGEGKFRCVVENEDWPLCRGKPLLRRIEVSGEDLCLAYTIVVEKAICRLSGRPIPASQRNRLADSFRESFHQLGKTLLEPNIGEIAILQLL